MKLISTRTHGILDYTMGVILLISPWLFNFANGGAAMWVPILVGIGVIFYSAFTDYEYGGARVLSMQVHLWLDILGGLFLAASPWIFGFADFVYLPHLIFGLAEIGATLITDPVPKTSPMNTKAI